MDKKYEIILSFIKDLSIETPDAETLLFVRENIDKYQLGIDISSKPLKNKMIEVSTKLSFRDKSTNEKKSVFEIDSARDFSLSAETSKIARSRDFRVISTKSWFQNIKNKDEFLKSLENKNLDYETIKQKIYIEAMWNQFIYQKYSNNIVLLK